MGFDKLLMFFIGSSSKLNFATGKIFSDGFSYKVFSSSLHKQNFYEESQRLTGCIDFNSKKTLNVFIRSLQS
jgi:hypothetical protein